MEEHRESLGTNSTFLQINFLIVPSTTIQNEGILETTSHK
jgi:hypothetical protein